MNRLLKLSSPAILLPALMTGILVICRLAAVSHAQAVLAITPDRVTIRDGESTNLTITPPEGIAQFDPRKYFAEWNDLVDVRFDAGKVIISAKKSGSTDLTIQYRDGETTYKGSVKVTVTQVVKPETIRVLVNGQPLGRDETVEMVQGEEKSIDIRADDIRGQPFSGLVAKLATTTGSLVRIKEASGNTPNTLVALGQKGVNTGRVSVKYDDKLIQELQIKVLEAVKNIEPEKNPVIIPEGTSQNLTVTISGEEGGSYKPSDEIGRSITVSSSSALVAASIKDGSLVLAAKDLPATPVDRTAKVTLQSLKGKGNNREIKTVIDVLVSDRYGYITFEPPTGLLLPNGTFSTTATVRNKQGVEDVSKSVEWRLADPADEKWVGIAPSGKKLTIIWNAPADEATENGNKGKRPSVVRILATARGGDQPVEGAFFIRMEEVARFAPMRVKLNVMDDLTASDLYGKEASKDYYILIVRLFNDLKDLDTNEYTGASVLAYSGPIEIAVSIERKFDKELKTAASTCAPAADDGMWHHVNGDELICNMNLAGPTEYVDLKRPKLGREAEPTCRGTITYRPLTFEMVVNTSDRRDERSFRARAFRLANLVGTGFSFVTAVAVPGSGSDLPLGLEKYSNLFLPGMEKLFPSKQEFHRQNLVSQVMKPIEEIPFGADLTRVLFVPRKAIKGLIPGHAVRISQICPYYFKAQVAIIKKGGRTDVQQGNQAQ
jgi:hypothetical protein